MVHSTQIGLQLFLPSSKELEMKSCPPLPYLDAHSHVHLGLEHRPPVPPSALLEHCDQIRGLALMSTHPRDYSVVVDTLKDYSSSCPEWLVVPCFGIHPWFLHQVDNQQWKDELEGYLKTYPNAIVGEVGLDGHRYHPDTRELASPMDQQVQFLHDQLVLAHVYDRPVSLHAVQCWQPLMTTLSKLRDKRQLPPKLYFHAFGGKVGLVDQILALLKSIDVYFGFAPVINFRSPDKTAQVIRRVGLSRIVLESDHEDATLVMESLVQGAEFIAKVLEVPVESVVQTTFLNSQRLYNLGDPNKSS